MSEKYNFLTTKIDYLSRRRNMLLLARKIYKENLSVSKISELIFNLSRVDRVLLSSYLNPKNRERYNWALEKVKTERRRMLTAAFNENNLGFYLSKCRWLEKLELLSSNNPTEINRMIKKSIRLEFRENGFTREFENIMITIKNGNSKDSMFKTIVDGFRKIEKEAMLEIFSDILLGDQSEEVLREFKNRLSQYGEITEFDGEFILNLVEILVQKYFKCEQSDFELDFYTLCEIDMNLKSASLTTNSILASTPGVAYFIALINFFQEISCTDVSGNPIRYYSYSHALTTYYLRILSKHGIIEIENLEEDGFEYLTLQYMSLCSSERKRSLKMFDVIFTKKHDIEVGDLEWIRKLLENLNIPIREIFFDCDEDGVLRARLNPNVIKENLTNGIFDERIEKLLDYENCDKENPNMNANDKLMKMKMRLSSKK